MNKQVKLDHKIYLLETTLDTLINDDTKILGKEDLIKYFENEIVKTKRKLTKLQFKLYMKYQRLN